MTEPNQQIDPIAQGEAVASSDETAVLPNIDYASRRRERALERRRTSQSRTVWWAVGAVVLVLALLVVAEAVVSTGRVHPGVTVLGVKVGGMKPSNASAALRNSLPGKVDQPVVVVYGDKTWKVTPKQVRLTFDYPSSVQQAMLVGREPGVFPAIGSRVKAWASGIDVTATPVADQSAMDGVLDAVAEGTNVDPVNASVRFSGTTPRVVDGKDGRALDRSAMNAALLAAFMSGDKRIEAPVVVDPMKVTRDDAEKAAKVAAQMVSAPAVIRHQEKSWEFTPEDIADWIDFRSTASGEGSITVAEGLGAIEPWISPELATEPLLDEVGEKVGRPAKNATFSTSGGKVTINPSQDGVGPDIESLSRELTAVLMDPNADRSVELRTHRTTPEITTVKASSMGIKERISTYTTTYSSSAAARVNNIHLLGDSLDGKLIPPGETFSFNGYVGERTAAKGYKEAPAIVQGKLVPQLGGGICQVGTTLFNAAFLSGLPIEQRHNHSFYISHYPKGRDATVSWGGPDLKFKNETDSWVLVSVSYTSSSITISLYGTDPGYEVSSETGPWTNERPYPTTQVKDPQAYVGSKYVEEKGITGRSIVVKRTVTKDGKVVRTDTFKSNYRPKAEVVRIGTKPRSSTATSSP